MEAGAGHHVGFGADDVGDTLLRIDQFDEA